MARASTTQGNLMTTAEAVRLIGMLEEITSRTPSEELNAAVAVLLPQVRACVPADQQAYFDRYCERSDYRAFQARMEASREAA
jgi:hypothetical protein